MESLAEEGHGLFSTAQRWEYLEPGEPLSTQLVMFQCLKINLGCYRVEAGLHVVGYSGAYHRRYRSLKVAQLAWDNACMAGRVGPRREWGIARANELTSRQPPVLVSGDGQSHQDVSSGYPRQTPPRAQSRSHPSQAPSPSVLSITWQISSPSSSRLHLSHEGSWYAVIMGAYPGVYFGR